LGESQARKCDFGKLLPEHHAEGIKNEKGPEEPALSEFCFLLPVGLADFMETDATVDFRSRQRDSANGLSWDRHKKTAPFQGRGQSTGRKSPSARTQRTA
jgi:hypothetical protein